VIMAYFFLPGQMLTGGDAQRVGLVSFSILVASVLAWKTQNIITYFFAVFLVFCLYIFIGGEFLAFGFLKQAAYLVLVLAVVFLSSVVDLKNKESLVFIALLYVQAFANFIVGYLAYGGMNLSFGFGDMFPWYDHVRYFNHFQSATLLVLPLLVMNGGSRLIKVFSYVVGGVALAMLIASQGRGTVISIVVGYLAVFLLVKNRNWLRAYSTVFIAMVLIGFLIYLIFGLNSILGVVRDVSVNNRSELWELAVAEIFERPFFGWGAYTYGFGKFPVWMPAHPHQALLLIAYEWGIPLAMLVLIGGVSLVVAIGRKLVFIQDKNRIVLFACLVSLCVHGQVSAVFTMPVGQLMFALILGQLISLPKGALVFLRKPSVFGVLGFAVGVWIWVVFSYIQYQGEDGDVWNRVHDRDSLAPRTWHNAS